VRQMGWAYPDGSPGHETYDRGGIQAVTVAGRALLAGMYCDAEGRNRIDLRDTVTGAVIDAYGHTRNGGATRRSISPASAGRAAHTCGTSGPSGVTG